MVFFVELAGKGGGGGLQLFGVAAEKLFRTKVGRSFGHNINSFGHQ
jgi:hypothetical protein